MIGSFSVRDEHVKDVTFDTMKHSWGTDHCVTIGCVALWFDSRKSLEDFTHKLAAYIESLEAPEQA